MRCPVVYLPTKETVGWAVMEGPYRSSKDIVEYEFTDRNTGKKYSWKRDCA